MLEPLYRVKFNVDELLREHPPVLRHPHKVALFELAYPDQIVAAEQLEVTRWAPVIPDTISFSAATQTDVQPNFYDYRPIDPDAALMEWHVNFADPRLFVAYGSGLFAQDEIQVAEHPRLGSAREAFVAQGLVAMTVDHHGGTPILVRHVERRIEVLTNVDAASGRPRGLYGNQFAASSWDAVSHATRRIDPPTFSNMIAIAAPGYGHGEYSKQQIELIFVTAFTAFTAAVQEASGRQGPDASKIAIHTGFWGCGAFGGNRKMMIALQRLAAVAAHVDRLIFHAGDETGLKAAQEGIDLSELIAWQFDRPCTLDALVDHVWGFGCRWGVSDGN